MISFRVDNLEKVAAVLEEHEDWTLAGNVYKYFLRQNSQSLDGYLGLGRVLASQKKYVEAVAVLEKGFERTSDSHLRDQLEGIYEVLFKDPLVPRSQKFDAAARAIWGGFCFESVTETLVRHAAPLKRHLEAVSLLEQVLRGSPENAADLMHVMATLAFQAGDEKRARDILFVLLDRYPEHAGGKRLFQVLSSS